eukprot:jgi/Chlat1/6965/Chrsp52S06619
MAAPVVFAVNGERAEAMKIGCGEGGCGACAVEVLRLDPCTGKVHMKTLNSCLCPVASVHAAAIITAEGIGNASNGFHPIQGIATISLVAIYCKGIALIILIATVLAQNALLAFTRRNAASALPALCSQVATHAALVNKKLGDREHEAMKNGDAFMRAIDGNLCRCTGYRPIIDACRSLVDGVDVEDLGVHSCAVTPCADCPVPTFPDFLKAFATAAKLPTHTSERCTWRSPLSLSELWTIMASTPGIRLVAANTGPGIFKDWPRTGDLVWVGAVAELRVLRVEKERAGGGGKREVVVGGAVSFGELVDLLEEERKRHHVRYAATIGGHFALWRQRAFESDACTLLAAADARVCVASRKDARWLSVQQIQDASTPLDLGGMEVVKEVHVPLPSSGERFFTHKIARGRKFNSHAVVNIAVRLTPSKAVSGKSEHVCNGTHGNAYTARIVFGAPDSTSEGSSKWVCGESPNTEAALNSRPLNMQALITALEAFRTDTTNAGVDASHAQVLQALLFEALAGLTSAPFWLLSQGEGGNASAADLLANAKLSPAPSAVRGTQIVPDDDPSDRSRAPVHRMIPKDRARLQASGEAAYVSDLALPRMLHGAYVESTRPLAMLESVDPCLALGLPGVRGFVCAKDICGMVQPWSGGQPIFANKKVEYVGQPVGLILADTSALAQEAAAMVNVVYVDTPPSALSPILSLSAARAAESFFTDPTLASMGVVSHGHAAEALRDAEYVLKGVCTTPPQQHFYLEPQVALAAWDEGAGEESVLRVWSSTQSIDAVQNAVAKVVGVPAKNVCVTCRRLGGGFGGKTSWPMYIAAAAAVAAEKLHVPVRLNLDRNADFRLGAGRAESLVEYEVGFDGSGMVQALRVKGFVQAGPWHDTASFDLDGLAACIDSAYNIPHLSVDVKLCRTNLAPRVIMRAPGYSQAALVNETIMEHVAAHLGIDSATVKRRNFFPPSTPPSVPRPLTEPLPSSNGVLSCRRAGRYRGIGSDGGGKTPGGKGGAAVGPVKGLDTMVHVWEQLLDMSDYEARAAHVEAFNAKSVWRKRGIAVAPTKFSVSAPPNTASVNVYGDGTFVVAAGGLEMGQGLHTKVLQTAVYALSMALPEARDDDDDDEMVVVDERPLPMSMARMSDTSSEVVPGGGETWGSTGSEGACAAARNACAHIVRSIKPYIKPTGNAVNTWCAALSELYPDPMFGPPNALLSAYGYFDGTVSSDDVGNADAAPSVEYPAFGASCSEVEIDILTGEKEILRSDLVYDVGRSLNPALDIGQMEGAFVQGVGWLATEEVMLDPESGRLVTDSTWTYKPPSSGDLPKDLRVAFLKNSRNPRGVMSSKAIGESTFMLAVAVLSALRKAAAAGRAQLSNLAGDVVVDDGGNNNIRKEKEMEDMLAVPATHARIRAACGEVWVADLLRRAAPNVEAPKEDGWELV